MKKRLLAILCAFVLLLTACGEQEQNTPEGAYKVYFATLGEQGATQSVGFEYRLPDPKEDPVQALIKLLLAGPESEILASPLLPGVRLRSATLGEDGQLHLDLSEQYNGLPGVYLTVANACFVLTLSQVEGVESVNITVEGEPLPYQAVQSLHTSDLLLSGAEEDTVSVNALLYFPRKEGGSLGAEYRTVVKTENDSLPAAVLSALLEGPTNEDLTSFMPQGTLIRSVKAENGLCKVDLSQAFQTEVPQDEAQARMSLYSIVNTLCALDGVKLDSVLFLVEGMPLSLYGGLPTLAPLEPNYSLAS